MKHCKKPCPECPYMKTSMPGYFGGNDPKEYALAIHLDTVVACHMKSSFGEDERVTDVTICAGHLFAQKKAAKRTVHPDAIEAWADQDFQQTYEEMKDDVLGLDFYTHHKIDTSGS